MVTDGGCEVCVEEEEDEDGDGGCVSERENLGGGAVHHQLPNGMPGT